MAETERAICRRPFAPRSLLMRPILASRRAAPKEGRACVPTSGKPLMLLAVMLATLATLPSAPAQAPPTAASALATATFAGGCFWCMEPPFDKLPGVVSTTSGYMGGPKRNPTYQEVSSGSTGHAEVVQIAYDPAKVS